MLNFWKKKTQIEPPRPVEPERNFLLEFAEYIGDIHEYKTDPEEEDRMFKELGSIDFLQEYLRSSIARDMQRYFAATTEEQRLLIKGAIARTSYLRSRIASREDHKVIPTKMKGLRYAG